MELQRIEIDDGEEAGRVRLRGLVDYDGVCPAEWLWFDLPARLAPQISRLANPWLACLLPLAVTLRQPLRLCAPIDPMMARGALGLMTVWKRWFAGSPIIPIEAELSPWKPHGAKVGRLTGSFFSGGVDSLFTAIGHDADADPAARQPIHEHICIWGADVPLARPQVWDEVRSSSTRAATALGRPLIDVATNLRDTGWRRADWEPMAHGALLAAVGLTLEERYRMLLIPSSIPYRGTRAWGSTPLTDALYSTSSLDFRDDGASFPRADKLRRLGRSDFALQAMRVCWQPGQARNCGRCGKCIRTMIILELHGDLERCSAFPALDVRHIAEIDMSNRVGPSTYTRARDQARAAGREDIARAIDRALRRVPFQRAGAYMRRSWNRLRPSARMTRPRG